MEDSFIFIYLLCFKNVLKDILTFGPYVVKCLQPHKKRSVIKNRPGAGQ